MQVRQSMRGLKDDIYVSSSYVLCCFLSSPSVFWRPSTSRCSRVLTERTEREEQKERKKEKRELQDKKGEKERDPSEREKRQQKAEHSRHELHFTPWPCVLACFAVPSPSPAPPEGSNAFNATR
mmetsp:Transcript_13553/g.26894  ORF Transcript_13553/g.26894 Transcript_13553/m.26894 type:complete len:124 (+) Transcript_13553:1117-1488(+)